MNGIGIFFSAGQEISPGLCGGGAVPLAKLLAAADVRLVPKK
jgi:hypothetical protein